MKFKGDAELDTSQVEDRRHPLGANRGGLAGAMVGFHPKPGAPRPTGSDPQINPLRSLFDSLDTPTLAALFNHVEAKRRNERAVDLRRSFADRSR